MDIGYELFELGTWVDQSHANVCFKVDKSQVAHVVATWSVAVFTHEPTAKDDWSGWTPWVKVKTTQTQGVPWSMANLRIEWPFPVVFIVVFCMRDGTRHTHHVRIARTRGLTGED